MSAVVYNEFDGFEYDVEPDSGWFLSTGEQWTGWRVKYRRKGTRRWAKFIVQDATSETDVETLIRFHARGVAA